jgi:hypothetical protein
MALRHIQIREVCCYANNKHVANQVQSTNSSYRRWLPRPDRVRFIRWPERCVVARLRTKMERENGRQVELVGDKYKANAAA